MTPRPGRQTGRLRPWLLVALWICVIWGHSLMPGGASSAESSWLVPLAQRVCYAVVNAHLRLVDRFVAAHPNFVRSLADAQVMHFYVRKAGHFTEYLVLGTLVFNAIRSTVRSVGPALLVLVCLWLGTPAIDEFIQLHIPERSGQLTDVLIDLGGFGCGLTIAVILWAVGAGLLWLLKRLAQGPRRQTEAPGQP